MKLAAVFLAAVLPAPAQKTHELCAPCHSTQVADFQSHAHRAKDLSCDACHGASQKHVEAGGVAAPDRVAAPNEQPGLCGACHPGPRKEYQTSKHWKLVEARSKTRSASCGLCHGSHAARPAASMETQCRRCHQDLPAACRKTDHPAASGISCVACHRKHTNAATAAKK